jgi:anti-anti-sigma factor
LESTELNIVLPAKLDIEAVQALYEQITQVSNLKQNINFDTEKLSIMTSAGLQLFIAIKKQFANQENKLSIINISPELLNILEDLGLKEFLLG